MTAASPVVVYSSLTRSVKPDMAGRDPRSLDRHSLEGQALWGTPHDRTRPAGG